MSSCVRDTWDWIGRTVVGLGLCPFAAAALRRQAVHIRECQGESLQDILQSLFDEVDWLESHDSCQTGLLVIPAGLEKFDDYLDCLAMAAALLQEQGFEGVYQLASFHPDYCFDGLAPDDPANATNRAPWPVLQLLREAEVSRVLQHFAEPENIPAYNIELMRRLGQDQLAILQNFVDEPYDRGKNS